MSLNRRSPCRSLEQLVGRSTDATLPSIRTAFGRSYVRRIPLESRAGSEPNFQPELDKTPEPCVLSSSGDRKSTRLNSSHANISYAVFCLNTHKTRRCSGSHPD